MIGLIIKDHHLPPQAQNQPSASTDEVSVTADDIPLAIER